MSRRVIVAVAIILSLAFILIAPVRGAEVYTLTVTPIGEGSVEASPDQASYLLGDNVQLTASPSTGWSFTGWGGDASGTDNPLVVNIDASKTVTATFTQDVYSLTISSEGNGGVTLNNPGPYHLNDVVELTATPGPWWVLSSWSGDLTGSGNPATITMDGDKSVTATFTQLEYLITTHVDPAEGGSISADLPGPYHYGDVVTLTPSANSGYNFVEWLGAGVDGPANRRVITVTGDMDVTATFTQVSYPLNVAIVGNGEVTKIPDQDSYNPGKSVELTATPGTNWSFTGWSGDYTGTDNPITIVMDGEKSVTATFTQYAYTLTVVIVGSGSVEAIPNSATYSYGDTVQLTATPSDDWSFSQWSGDEVGSENPLTLTIDSDKSITAIFLQDEYPLTLFSEGNGAVTPNNPGPYHLNDVVELTATPDPGYVFSSWSGDLTGSSNPESITIDGAKSVTATFIQASYTLGFTVVGEGSVVILPDQATYLYGDSVQLTAIPALGWAFAGWSGGASGSENPTTITMDESKIVDATFIQSGYSLSVDVSGQGTVSRNPDQAIYESDSVVELTATPAQGWVFSGWSGDLSGLDNPASITLDALKVVTASFTQVEFTLTVITSPVGGGIVTKNPNEATYQLGEDVSLSAYANIGYTFSGWSGDGINSGAFRIVTINGDMSVQANFMFIGGGGGGGGGGGIPLPAQDYSVSFNSRDVDGLAYNFGEILLENVTINLPLSIPLTEGTHLISTNAPEGYLFDHWETSGGVSVQSAQSRTTGIVVSGEGTVTVVYAVRVVHFAEYTLGFDSVEENGTSVNLGQFLFKGESINATGVAQSGPGNFRLDFVPASGFIFLRWETSGGVALADSMTNPVTISVAGNCTLKAVYLIQREAVRIEVKDDAGNPLENVSVTITLDGVQHTGVSDAGGYVIFVGLPVGHPYQVVAYGEGYVAGNSTVTSEANRIATGTLTLGREVFPLIIRVLDEAEKPLSGARVVLSGGPYNLQGLGQSTDSSGVTTFDVAYLGQYYVSAEADGYAAKTGLVNYDKGIYTFKLAASSSGVSTFLQPIQIFGGVVALVSVAFIADRLRTRGKQPKKSSFYEG